jgi:hypothetical protein
MIAAATEAASARTPFSRMLPRVMGGRICIYTGQRIPACAACRIRVLWRRPFNLMLRQVSLVCYPLETGHAFTDTGGHHEPRNQSLIEALIGWSGSEIYNRASEQMRKKTTAELKVDLFLEIIYVATAATVAIALLLNVHLSPKFIGPAGTVLCSNVACFV